MPDALHLITEAGEPRANARSVPPTARGDGRVHGPPDEAETAANAVGPSRPNSPGYGNVTAEIWVTTSTSPVMEYGNSTYTGVSLGMVIGEGGVRVHGTFGGPRRHSPSTWPPTISQTETTCWDWGLETAT